MFEELGLNVARQPDNAANPRPDNRSGWLCRRDAGRGRGASRSAEAAAERRSWRGAAVGPLHAAALPRQAHRSAAPGRRAELASRSPRRERHDERDRRAPGGAGASRPHPPPAPHQRPAGPDACCSTGKPVLLLCSNNYLGLADHPRVREAAAEAAMRWGVGAGASRLVSGTMTIHRRLEERLAEFEGTEACRAVRLGVPGEPRRDRRARRAAATRSSPTSSTTPRSSTAAACRAPRSSSTATATSSTARLEPAPHGARRPADRDRLVFSMDGDIAPLAEIVELAQASTARAWSSTRRTPPATSGRTGAAPSPRRGCEGEVDVVIRDARQGARLLRRLRLREPRWSGT